MYFYGIKLCLKYSFSQVVERVMLRLFLPRKLPYESGLASCHTFGKTLRGDFGKNSTFVLRRCSSACN